MRIVEQIWTDDGALSLLARAALFPLGGLFRGVVAIRASMYDRGLLTAERAPIPVVSVGNLTVGGTGKTPISAWIAQRLAGTGRVPAIVLRGYGGDEPLVHERLNPRMPVVVSAEPASGIREAVARGADVAVLDDAFQHRKMARDADIVLVSADRWTSNQRMLPAGPWREPLSALRRASIAVITRKSADDQRVEQVSKALAIAAPETPQAVIRLAFDSVNGAADPRQSIPLQSLAGKRLLAVAAIGDPKAFFRQLQSLGAHVIPRTYRDHHAFSKRDVARLLGREERVDAIVCTLKDAVKLAPLWPDGAPSLWYVSISVRVETGLTAIDDILRRVATPRPEFTV